MSPLSHGFRPGRNCHTALRNVQKDFKDTDWLIEGNISKFFETINYKILDNFLRKKIQDERFLNLIHSGCKAKIILPQRGRVNSRLGTYQGSILSPLLANIYLHEFDIRMHQIIKETASGLQKRQIDDYSNRVSEFNKKSERYLKYCILKKTNFNFRCCSYVRYADDFIIGLTGPRSVAIQVESVIVSFLKTYLNLLFNSDKIKIIFFSKTYSSFLGYKIKNHPKMIIRISSTRVKIIRRRHVILKSDTSKVIRNLNENGFCRKDGYPIPKFAYLNVTQSITNKKINRILNKFYNYYLLADNRCQFIRYIFYILSLSVAKMYAAKFR